MSDELQAANRVAEAVLEVAHAVRSLEAAIAPALERAATPIMVTPDDRVSELLASPAIREMAAAIVARDFALNEDAQAAVRAVLAEQAKTSPAWRTP